MADRKTPKQYRSEQMVNDIVEATAAVVTDRGLNETTVEGIATKAGVSPGSIYQYFSTKKSILGSFVTSELEGSRSAVLQILDEWKDLPIRELNQRLTNFMINYFAERAKTAEQVFPNIIDLGKSDAHMRMRREVIQILAQILKQHRDELIVEDCDKAAAVVIHAMMGALTAPLVDKEFPYTISDLRQDLVALADRYLLGT